MRGISAGQVRDKTGFVLLAVTQLVGDLVVHDKWFEKNGFLRIELRFAAERIKISGKTKIMAQGTEDGRLQRNRAIPEKRILLFDKVEILYALVEKKAVFFEAEPLKGIHVRGIAIQPLLQHGGQAEQVIPGIALYLKSQLVGDTKTVVIHSPEEIKYDVDPKHQPQVFTKKNPGQVFLYFSFGEQVYQF